MVAINFNAQNVAPAEAGLPVWEGLVPVTISRCEVANTSANNGSKYLAVFLKAAMGRYAGQENVVRLNLWNVNPQAVDIAQRELSSISHVTGRMQLNDTNDLIGANMLTIWEKGTREIENQQTGKKTTIDSCECKEYRITDGRTIKELRGGQPASNPFDVQAFMASQGSAPAAAAAPAPAPQPSPAMPVSPQQMQGGGAQPGFTPPAAPQTGTAGPATGGGFAAAPGGAPSPAAGGFGTAAGPAPSNGGFSPPAGPAQGGFGQPGAAPAQGGFTPPAAGPQGGGFGGPAPAGGGFQPGPGGAGPWAQQ
jgi:hypothetical protein